MNDVIARRLVNQKLTRPGGTAADVVATLGAMQAQDYPGAKWAIGLRADVTDADVERACNDGSIVRTHILRQTWHFVARADIRWMLALSGPRVNAVNAHYYRKLDLDERTCARSRTVIERALRDGTHLTRTELSAALRRAGIVAAGTRLAFLTMRAELDGVICNGPKRGNQFTYALLDERVPPATAIDRDAALAKLAQRYFSSHGPATLKDYVWWSGLTVRDAKAGIELASLPSERAGDLTCWFVGKRTSASLPSPTAYLLPNYDEYLIAYKDRGLVVDGAGSKAAARIKDPFAHHIVVDGKLSGSWTRQANGKAVAVELTTYARPTACVRRALEATVARLGRFMEVPVTSSWADRR